MNRHFKLGQPVSCPVGLFSPRAASGFRRLSLSLHQTQGQGHLGLDHSLDVFIELGSVLFGLPMLTLDLLVVQEEPGWLLRFSGETSFSCESHGNPRGLCKPQCSHRPCLAVKLFKNLRRVWSPLDRTDAKTHPLLDRCTLTPYLKPSS